MNEDIIDGEVIEDDQPEQSHAVAIRPDAPANLFHSDDPAVVIQKATAHATALADVVRQKNLITRIQGSEHVQVEGWTLLGSMLGVFPVTVWSRPLEDPAGWEARVEARTLAGQTVGAAEAQCTRDERTWKGRDDYALRSMAQTRATSKALRMPLGFVMQLAGFAPTPADEMPQQSSPRSAQPSQPRGEQPAQPQPDRSEPTTPQIQKLAITLRELGVDDDAKKVLLAKYGEGVTSTKQLSRSQVSALIDMCKDAPERVKKAAGIAE